MYTTLMAAAAAHHPHIMPELVLTQAGKWVPCRYIEWKPKAGSFYCNLCEKHADEKHMASDTHKRQFASYAQGFHRDAVTREDGSHLRINRDFEWPTRTSWGSAPIGGSRPPPPPPPGLPPPAQAAQDAIPEQHRIGSDVSGDLEDATTAIVVARTELEDIKTELLATKTEVVAAKTEVVATKTELEELKTELAAATAEVAAAKTALAEMNIAMELLRKSVEDVKLLVEALVPTGAAHRALGRSQSSIELPKSSS